MGRTRDAAQTASMSRGIQRHGSFRLFSSAKKQTDAGSSKKGQSAGKAGNVGKASMKSKKTANVGAKASTSQFLSMIYARPVEKIYEKEGIEFYQKEMTAEEKEKAKMIMHEYTKQRFIEHAEIKKSINLRRILHQSAIENLPTEEMKMKALIPDTRPFPTYRRVPTWTPPIKTS